MSTPIVIATSTEELIVVWAALYAMVEDVHTPQDNLTAAQWEAAARLCKRLTELVDALPPGTVSGA